MRNRIARGAFAVLLGSSLSACLSSIDADQARVCRSVVSALNPGTSLSIGGVASGPVPRSLRVSYELERTGGPRHRFIVCVFAADGLSPNKAELTGVSTQDGPVSDASLFFLRRYYLETPEGIAGDAGSRIGPVPEVPAPLAYGLQQLLLSLPRTAIYALLATAYALVFGLVDRINLAFGELMAVGSAATVAGSALVLTSGTTAPLIGLAAGLACALSAGALYSAVGGYFTLSLVRERSPQPSLIATVGLSMALMEYLRAVQSPVTVWLPPIWSEAWTLMRAGDFFVSLTPISLVTAGIAILAGSALLWLMQSTGFGRAWRAYSDDAGAAELHGVDGARLLRQTLALAGAMAGLSGMLIVAQYGGLGFAGGFQYGLKALIASIVGGIGSVPGALIGGIAVGLFETLWSSYLPIDARDIALYTALVVFLVFRPGGFLGIRGPTPRPV